MKEKRKKIISKVYRLNNVNRINDAEKLILPIFKENPRDLFARMASWPNYKLAYRLSNTYISILVNEHRYAQALEICKWCLEQNKSYSIPSALIIKKVGILFHLR